MGEVRFDGRVVVVTGAGSGLGRSYAETIAARGGSVVVNDAGVDIDGSGGSTARAQIVADEIAARGGRALASADSVAERAGCERLVALALDRFGRVDAVIHSAGNVRNGPFTEMTDDAVRALIDTHLMGAFHLTQIAFGQMAQRGYGRFVFTSSASGLFGRSNGANYAMVKAGIVGLCNAVAIEGHELGILANAVLPVAATRLVPRPAESDVSQHAAIMRTLTDGERGDPAWVTPLVAYLASDRCERTHRLYSAVRGRYGEVFIGVSHGWVIEADRTTPPAPEEIESHLDTIEGKDTFDLPQTTAHEIALVSQRLG